VHQWYVKSEIKIHQGFVADKLKNGLMVGLSSGGGREGHGRSASDKHCFRDGDGNADIVLQKQGDRLSYLNRLSNPIFGRRYGTTTGLSRGFEIPEMGVTGCLGVFLSPPHFHQIGLGVKG